MTVGRKIKIWLINKKMKKGDKELSFNIVLKLRCKSIFFFQAEDGIRDIGVTGVQTCALPISMHFESSCYTRLSMAVLQPDVSAEERIAEKRILERGAVPTIDVAVAENVKAHSNRDIRMAKKVSQIFAFVQNLVNFTNKIKLHFKKFFIEAVRKTSLIDHV